MARQLRRGTETDAVDLDLDRFFLPFDASLDLFNFSTYGVTDPDIDLSMVNVRHLKAVTSFRGVWDTSPTDGDQEDGTDLEIPYIEGNIVVGSDELLYRRNNVGLTTNPNPVGNAGANWVPLGRLLAAGTTVDTSTGAPGIVLDTSGQTTTLNFRGYREGTGVTIDNSTGEISVGSLSLTDVHMFTTALNRNAGIEAPGSTVNMDIRWHRGDVAIVSTNADTVTEDGETQGQGTYVYIGSDQTSFGTTMNEVWALLAIPAEAITMVAGNPGPVVTTSQIVSAINNGNDQILTDDEYTKFGFTRRITTGSSTPSTNPTGEVGDLFLNTTDHDIYYWTGSIFQLLDESINLETLTLRGNSNYNGSAAVSVTNYPVIFSGSGAPATSLGDGTRATGDIYIDTSNMGTFYFFNGTAWRRSSISTIADIGDTPDSTDIAANEVLIRNDANNAWEAKTLAVIADDASEGIALENLHNVADTTANNTMLIKNGDDWEVKTLSTISADTTEGIKLEDTNNTPTPASTGDNTILIKNGAGDTGTWEAKPLSTIADDADEGIALENLHNVMDSTSDNTMLIKNGANWEARTLANIADDSTEGIALQNLHNVNDTPPTSSEEGRHLVWTGTEWAPGTANISTESVEDLSDTARYPERRQYRSIGVITQGVGRGTPPETNEFKMTTNSFFPTLGPSQPQVYLVRDTNFINGVLNQPTFDALMASPSTELFGPFDIEDAIGDDSDDPRSLLITGPVGDLPTIAANFNAVVDAGATAMVFEQTNRLGPPGDNFFITWNQTDGATGAGQWVYNRLSDITDQSTNGVGFSQLNDIPAAVNGGIPTRATDGSAWTMELPSAIAARSGTDGVALGNLNNVSGNGSDTQILVNVNGVWTPSTRRTLTIRGSTYNNAAILNILGGATDGVNKVFLGTGNPTATTGSASEFSEVGARRQSGDLYLNTAGSELWFWNQTANGGAGAWTQVAATIASINEITDVEAPVADNVNNDILSWDDTARSGAGAWTPTSSDNLGLIDEVTVGTNTSTLTTTNGNVTIPNANATDDGLMSSGDFVKLSDIPARPTPGNDETIRYALQVETDSAGVTTESWITEAELQSQSNLVFDADNDRTLGSATLQRFRYEDGTTREIESASFNASNQLVLTFPRFSSTVALIPTVRNFNWDEVIDSNDTGILGNVRVQNTGFTRFIQSVSSIGVSGTENNTLGLTNFTASAITDNAGNPFTPAASGTWNQSFTPASGVFIRDAAPVSAVSPPVGGTVTITYGFQASDSTSATPTDGTNTQRITWATPTLVTTLPAASGRQFYERYTTLTLGSVSTGIGSASNRSFTYSQSGTPFTSIPATTSNASNSNTLTLTDFLYKDRTSVTGSITTSLTVSRPANVGGTAAYNRTLTSTRNIPTASFNNPVFRLSGGTIGDTINAYNSANNTALTILTGDFSTGAGMTTQTGVSTSFGNLNLPQGVHWFGQIGTTAPTIRVEALRGTGSFVNPTAATTSTSRVDFSTSNLTGSNVPSGWTTVTYSFRSIRVTDPAGQLIQIS